MDDLEQLIRGAAQPSAKGKDYSALVTDDLLDRLRKVESGKDPYAVNKQTKALGAYQFMPETVADLHRKGYKFNPFDEKESRQAAKQYLTELLGRSGGDIDKALAAYGGFVTKDPSQYVSKVKGDEPKQKTAPSEPGDELEQLIRGSATSPEVKTEKTAAPQQAPTAKRDVIAEMQQNFEKKAQEDTFGKFVGRKLGGVAEAGLSAITGAAAQPIGAAAGILETLTGGKFGTKEGIRAGQERAAQVAQNLTYQPRLQEGQDVLGVLQKGVEPAKIPPIVPEAVALQSVAGPAQAQMANQFRRLREQPTPGVTTPTVPPSAASNINLPPSVRQQAQAAATATPQQMAPEQVAQMQAAFNQRKAAIAPQAGAVPTAPVEAVPVAGQQKPMGSIGAAAVDTPQLRIQRAAELPIPIELSKDQITRDPADVRFARETAKDPVLGRPLQEHYARQNDLIQRNLDHMVEETGAEFTGLNPRELGEKLVNVIAPAKNSRKRDVRRAYDEARNAGEMAQPVSVSPLEQFVASHQAEAINAPVIKSLELKIQSLKKDGVISLNDLEEVRKMVGRLSQDPPTNAKYGGDINKLIDRMTADKGGELYQKARRMNAEYMTEFEDTPVLKNITALKGKNSTQRAVAMEDLIDKSLLRGSYDDVQRLFYSLERMGEPGQQMIRELRGAVAQKIKDNATKNVQLDINGKPYVSTAALNNMIVDLDKSGKLDLLFGKKGAETYRTLNQVTKEIQTTPQGTTNPSGTAAQIGAMLTEIGAQTMMTGVPAPVVTGTKMLLNMRKQKQQESKISDFINYGKEQK